MAGEDKTEAVVPDGKVGETEKSDGPTGDSTAAPALAMAATDAAAVRDAWNPPHPAGVDEIVVSVIAEIEDNSFTAWTLTVPHAGALQQVASSWAERHSCPEAMVGLELDPDFAAAVAAGAATAGGAAAAAAAAAGAAAAGASLSSSSSLVPQGRGTLLDLSATPNDLGWTKWKHVCLFAVPIDSVSSPTACAAVSASPTASNPSGKTKRQAVSAAGTTRAAKNAKMNGWSENTSDLPGHDEPIEYLQENPKKRGSAGQARYELYRTATTLREALELGAAKGDLVHDWKRGYIRRKQ